MRCLGCFRLENRGACRLSRVISRSGARAWGLLVATVALLFSPNAAAVPGITPPKRQDKAEAVCPPDGKGDATVVLALVVDAEGAVSDVAVREGQSPFVEAAVAAVRTWRFAPATRADTPIAARIAAVVTFHAPSQAPPAQAVAPAPAPVPPASAGPAGAQPASAPEEIVQVAVKGEHEELGSIHIPRAETRFVPGAFGDRFRVIEALPGMALWISGLPYF